MKKPIIGITPRIDVFDKVERMFVNTSYIEAIAQAGGIGVLLPYSSKDDIEQALLLCDGVLVTGGYDMDPRLYNKFSHCSEDKPDERVDTTDLYVIHIATSMKLPILGICRGIQSICVAFQGTLIQDLPSQWPATRPLTHRQQKPSYEMEHTVKFTPNSYFESIFGVEYPVNSFHHQAIDTIDPQFRITGRCPDDGVIEAIEHTSLDIIAVQWHPERLLNDKNHFRIFTDFIQRCQKN